MRLSDERSAALEALRESVVDILQLQDELADARARRNAALTRLRECGVVGQMLGHTVRGFLSRAGMDLETIGRCGLSDAAIRVATERRER